MTIKLHREERFIRHAHTVLRELNESCRSLEYATILTGDGFEVASLSGDANQSRRVASMASSMQALGDAVARDLRMGACEYIIIASPTGYVIQMRVPNHPLVLAAHFQAVETLGKALSVARLTAASMGELPTQAAA